jgi:trehalose-6-phosphate synthase
MICSEFAGCNEAMRGVLKYNPFSLSSFVETMDMAMSLTEHEKGTRMNEAYKNIKRYSFSRWTEDFLKDLKMAYKPVKASYYLGIDFGNKNCGKDKSVSRDMV